MGNTQAKSQAKTNYNMGIRYLGGLEGVQKDEALGARHLQLAVDEGLANAQYELGRCYEVGVGVAKDDRKAIALYSQSAAQGYDKAQCALGARYSTGEGVPQNSYTAVGLFEKAAAQDNPTALFNMGAHYFNGEGVTKNVTTAISWFEKAATNGNIDAQEYLFDYYHSDETKDEPRALFWLEKLAERNQAEPQHFLALFYEKGTGGVAENRATAKIWYTKAAEQGFAPSQANLGLLYICDADFTNALIWLQKAAEQNNPNGQFNLGLCYLNGNGIDKDLTLAMQWMLKAAEQDQTYKTVLQIMFAKDEENSNLKLTRRYNYYCSDLESQSAVPVNNVDKLLLTQYKQGSIKRTRDLYHQLSDESLKKYIEKKYIEKPVGEQSSASSQSLDRTAIRAKKLLFR